MYSEKQELRNSNQAHYLGCLAFLCQVFTNIDDGRQPFQVLVKPSFEAIESLLDNKADEEEIMCGIRQVGRISKPLITVPCCVV